MQAWHFPRLPDWLIYSAVVAALLTAALTRREHADAPEAPPPPSQGEGDLLAPASPFDRTLTVKGGGAGKAAGTAFSVSDRGVWVTARHVVEGCARPALMVSPSQGVAAQVELDPDSDIAVLSTRGGAPALPLGLAAPLRIGERGFHPGFPQGRPGEAASRLLGRQTIISGGRNPNGPIQPVVAWAQGGRTQGLSGGLSGLSGAPVLDSAGRVIGVTIAEAPRRGRIYTAAPESLARVLARRKIAPPPPAQRDPVTVENYGRVADALRRELSVVQVACLA